MLQHLGVNPSGAKGEGAKFANLWKASLIGTLLNLATVIILPFFIPDVKQTDTLLAGPAALDPSHNPFCRRFCCGERNDRKEQQHVQRGSGGNGGPGAVGEQQVEAGGAERQPRNGGNVTLN